MAERVRSLSDKGLRGPRRWCAASLIPGISVVEIGVVSGRVHRLQQIPEIVVVVVRFEECAVRVPPSLNQRRISSQRIGTTEMRVVVAHSPGGTGKGCVAVVGKQRFCVDRDSVGFVEDRTGGFVSDVKIAIGAIRKV